MSKQVAHAVTPKGFQEKKQGNNQIQYYTGQDSVTYTACKIHPPFIGDTGDNSVKCMGTHFAAPA